MGSQSVISITDAIMAMTAGRSRLVSCDNISPEFIEYTNAINAARKKYKLYSEHRSFLSYTRSKGDNMQIVKYADVSEYLVSIRWETIADYYNATPMRRYGQWSRMNAARMMFMNEMSEWDAMNVVKCASADTWALNRYGKSDYYIKQKFSPSQSIIDVIDMNFDITYAIGKIAMVHANA